MHWIIYGWAIVFLFTGAGLLLVGYCYAPASWPDRHHDNDVGALFLGFFLYAWFIRWITEFAVNKKKT